MKFYWHNILLLIGQHDCCRRHRSRSRKKFNIGHFLTPHRGFDRLSQEESDTEFDPLNEESDEEEEYSITRKAWGEGKKYGGRGVLNYPQGPRGEKKFTKGWKSEHH